MYTGPSQAELGPDGAHFLVGRELAARNLGFRFCDGGVFLRCEDVDIIALIARKREHGASYFVLRFGRKAPDRFNGFVKELCHS